MRRSGRRATGRAASFGLSPIVSLKQSLAFVGLRQGATFSPARLPAPRRRGRAAGRFHAGAHRGQLVCAQRLERTEILRLNGAWHGAERRINRARVGRGSWRMEPRASRCALAGRHTFSHTAKSALSLSVPSSSHSRGFTRPAESDAALVAERLAAIGLLDALRRGKKGLDACDIVGRGKIQRRRDASVARIAPIGDRPGRKGDLEPGEVAVACNEPRLGFRAERPISQEQIRGVRRRAVEGDRNCRGEPGFDRPGAPRATRSLSIDPGCHTHRSPVPIPCRKFRLASPYITLCASKSRGDYETGGIPRRRPVWRDSS